MDAPQGSRRACTQALLGGLLFSATSALLSLLSATGCRQAKTYSCADPALLTDEARTGRVALKYVEPAPNDEP